MRRTLAARPGLRRFARTTERDQRCSRKKGNDQRPAKHDPGQGSPACGGAGTRRSRWTSHRSELAFSAELVGTFLFFFLGFSGIAASVGIVGSISPLGIAFGFGLGLALAITAFGHISGGHFNPAVTAGLTIAGKHPSHEVIQYWVAQLIGGFLAVAVMAIVYSSRRDRRARHEPGRRDQRLGRARARDRHHGAVRDGDPHRRDGRTGAVEGRHGAAADRPLHLHGRDDRRPHVRRLVQSRPGRSTPVLWNQDWGNVWIYLVGPLAGGILGAAIWVTLIGKGAEEATA